MPRLVLFCLLLLPLSGTWAQYEFVREFGTFGDDPGEFKGITDIAFNRDGDLVVTESLNRRVQLCDRQGACSVLSGFNPPNPNFQPTAVAVDNNGRIIVGETTKINVCTLSNATSCLIAEFGEPGGEAGQFERILGVAVNSNNRIIVSDNSTNRVQICRRTGECSFLGDPEPLLFQGAQGVTIDDQDRILVTERQGRGLRICNLQGICDGFSDIGNFQDLDRVAVDHAGRILLSDFATDILWVCDEAGSCAPIETSGGGPDDFFRLASVAADGEGYIAIARAQGNESILLYRDPDAVKEFLINQGLNDAWFNPDTNGQGFFIIVFEDIPLVFFAWFTYDTERPAEDVTAILGDPGHRWITAQGGFEGDTAELDLVVTRGGVFNTGEPEPENEIDGTITLVFESCTKGVVQYAIPSLGLMGEVPIQRIANDNVALCEALAEDDGGA